MSEDRFTELLGKKLAGEITPDELKDFNVLLAGNLSYRQEFESLQEYWQAEEHPSENISPIYEDIKRRAGIQEDELKVVSLHAYKAKYLWWKVAAAVLVFGLVSAATYQLVLSKKAENSNYLSSLKEVKTSSRLTQKVTLTDGTQITLNSESALKFPKEFKGPTRDVYLDGEAYFDVAKDKAHPFIVHTKKLDIRVLGTAFNIKSYNNDAAEETTLLRGSIEALPKNSSSTKILLKPTDKLILKGSGYSLTKQTYYNGEGSTLIETAWMYNKLTFKNETFDLLANSLSRKYGVKIIFQNDRLKAIRFTGEFEQEDLNQVLSSLKMITPFNFRTGGNNIYLY